MARMFAHLSKINIVVSLCALLATAAFAQSNDEQNKGFDIKSSMGDLHLGNDGNPREVGLPVYPGAHLRKDDGKDNNSANLSLFTQSFGWKLVVVNYNSDDSPAKVISYYRDKLKKYGKVLECHTSEHGGDVHVNDDDSKSEKSKDLKCDGDNTGPVVELKVGTEDNQHVVAVEQSDNGKGAQFTLVYVRTRGKQADI